ncbi:hypothetical protein [Mucilaginibacter sp. BT774]|uniref:hypothetical protein n=1 Tax=Mucilaginibacter sp. BT774 TaxID=3062276 RepID=UPI002675C002|nr:hypothetical protein [Mucilaginibacter sp. BT774]MDO3625888.1 hypothetical protein [Mucilaginibacter sp. BT774]
MERKFTKLTGSILMLSLLAVGFNAQAQTSFASDVKLTKEAAKQESSATSTETKATAKPQEDTTWKPQRRIWGYAFGDFYYNAHADAGNRGPEQNYNGVPQYRNAFQFRRIYLGYDYEITKKFKAELLLASEPSASTGVNGSTAIQNGDNLVDGKMAFYIKNINIRYRDLWNGTDLVVGEMATPGFAVNEPGTNGPTSLSETTWGYRFIEKTVSDVHKNNSYDVGAALQGTFDPKTKNFGYVLMVGDNTQASLLPAANANSGFYKIFYGDIWGKFLDKHLLVDIYADYVRTGPATAAIGGQAHNMLKGFIAYTSSKLSVGVEAYTQKLTNGVTNTTAAAPADATAQALSVWVKGAIVKDKLGFFARYDGYNPDKDYIGTDAYAATPGIYAAYTPVYKERFYTAGLDFTPTKNVHFAPNLWLVDYKDQRNSGVTGRVSDDHNLVYRMTFYYVFGK